MPSITSAELDALKGKIGHALTKRQPPTRKEREIVAAILAFLRTVPGVVAWRNNVGAVKDGTRYVRFGFAGASDIVGWAPTCNLCAGDLPGDTSIHAPCLKTANNVAQFLAIEVKRPGQHPTQEQAAFLKMVEQAGGISILARSVDDVRRALGL